MTKISRRGFLATGAGVTAAGVAAVTLPKLTGNDIGASPATGAATGALFAGDTPEDGAAASGSYVVSIRDASKGEVTVMNGETEYVVHDQALVSRVVAAANGSGK
jgi:hypothetical protein